MRRMGFVSMFVAVACLTVAAGANANDQQTANFHHVHLNVLDRDASIDFYARTFGAVPILYANKVPALFTERSFLLMNEVASPAPSALRSGIWHIGWGGVDVPNEFEWFKKQGVKIHTPLYALGDIHVCYLQGPDDELIEVNTMGHHRFGHVHLLAKDVNATTAWYRVHLGVSPRWEQVEKPDLTKVRAWSNSFRCDNVLIIVYGMPNYEPRPPWWSDELIYEFEPTEGRAIDHIAFSYRDIEPVFARMKANGVEIVDDIRWRAEDHHRSFFVRAPDKVLVEIVEAKPIPEGIWEED